MAVYTVKVSARPRPTIVKTRRKLKGNARGLAHAARKYLQACINHDARLTGGIGTVAAAQLIFAGDASAITDATAMVQLLSEALAATMKVIKK